MRFVHIVLVVVLFGFSTQAAENDEPFGVATVPAPDHPYAIHWRKVQDDWAVESKILDRCRAEPVHCPSREALQFLTIIGEARMQTGRAQIAYVNRALNLAIRYMSDPKNYGVPEVWTAPLATLANGAGDCTDYAIAKYFALGEVGVPENDRRLLVVSQKLRGGEHAVLAVRENPRWLILDNQRMTIVADAEANQYVPLLVFDHNGVRRFVAPVRAQLMSDLSPRTDIDRCNRHVR